MTICYIHGFASNGQGDKPALLKREFPQARIISPDLPTSPEEASNILDNLIYSISTPLRIVGTSLGGFYALHKAAKHSLKALIINPITNPSEAMRSVLGENTNYATGETFVWTEEDLLWLARMEKEIYDYDKRWEDYTILLGKQDEVINHNITKRYFSVGASEIIEVDDDHRLSHLDRWIYKNEVRSVFEK